MQKQAKWSQIFVEFLSFFLFIFFNLSSWSCQKPKPSPFCWERRSVSLHFKPSHPPPFLPQKKAPRKSAPQTQGKPGISAPTASHCSWLRALTFLIPHFLSPAEDPVFFPFPSPLGAAVFPRPLIRNPPTTQKSRGFPARSVSMPRRAR